VSEVHPPAPGFRHLLHRIRDPDSFHLALSGVQLAADFLAPQQLPARVEQFQSPRWTLDFHEAHVKARIHGPLPPGWGSVALMRSAADSAWHGFSGGEGVFFCLPPGQPIDGTINPGFVGMTIVVPPEIWERCRQVAGIAGEHHGRVTAHRFAGAKLARLEQALAATRELLRTADALPHLAPLAIDDTTQFITDLVANGWELSMQAQEPRESYRNRVRLARRAEVWMRAHLSEPFRVPDLCLALHVSRRELEYAFRVAFDQSPRDFIHALRLNAIRRVLQRTRQPASILDIALAHGVTHPSRFAAHYRAFFGERPSETVRG